VHGAVSLLESAATQKGLTLRTELSADLPERVSGDPARLDQVLTKVVDNAVKFSSHGQIVVNVCREAPGSGEKPHEDGTLTLLFCIQVSGLASLLTSTMLSSSHSSRWTVPSRGTLASRA
jgi:signal transduction histidine kinase